MEVLGAVQRFAVSAAVLHPYAMTSPTPTGSDGVDDVREDESPADENDTRAYLLTRAIRPFAPILKGFVQNPDRTLTKRGGPLADFIRNGDLRGLRALLFLHAIISNGERDNGWSTTLPLAVWARVFDTTKTAERRSASTSATKVLSRLAARRLIARQRTGRARQVTVTLLRPDGTGAAYTRPDGSAKERFLKLPNTFWTEGWYEQLDLPATAMLLVALHEKPGFELATERMPDWYGFSADTAERGLKTLRDLGLLHIHTRVKKAPLSPTGATRVNVYTLVGPFAPQAIATTPRKRTAKTDAKKAAKKTIAKQTVVKKPVVKKPIAKTASVRRTAASKTIFAASARRKAQ